MHINKLSADELWKRVEFVAGHSAGVVWWTPGGDDAKPSCPYQTEDQRMLWERGFEWGAEDAESAFYT